MKMSPYWLSLILFLCGVAALFSNVGLAEIMFVSALASMAAGVALSMKDRWDHGVRLTRVGVFLISLLCVWLIGGVYVSGTMQMADTIGGNGMLKTIGVNLFQDAACSKPLASIPWGTVESPSTNQLIAYIQTNGDSPENLSMTTGSWVPSNCPTYIKMNWNMTGIVMQPGQVKPVMFTLQVSSNATSSGITNFSFLVTVTGTG